MEDVAFVRNLSRPTRSTIPESNSQGHSVVRMEGKGAGLSLEDKSLGPPLPANSLAGALRLGSSNLSGDTAVSIVFLGS